jgi:hypothetical protein
MPEKKKTPNRRAEPKKSNKTNWEHRVTDPADNNGDSPVRDRSDDYEITTDYKRIPAKPASD